MATPPDELHLRQEKELKKLADQRVKQLLGQIESARKDLQNLISDVDSFTSQRVIFLNSQLDDIALRLRRELRSRGENSTQIAELVKAHAEQTISIITAKDIIIPLAEINPDILKRLSMAQLDRVSGMTALEIEKIKSVLFTKVGVLGQNPVKVARELVGKDSSFTGKYIQVENIIRTETNHIYNAQSAESIKVVNERYSLNLNERIVEVVEPQRNHPISLVLNGQIKKPGQKFRAKVSEVQAVANRINKGRVGGIFWPIKNGYYEGDNLPAHYFERGVVVATEKEPSKSK